MFANISEMAKVTGVPTTQWFLTSRERGNPSTRLDSRHHDDVAWTEGNLVRPLIHGAAYFAELYDRVSQMRDGDLLMFADGRGDPDERLTGSAGTEVGTVFAQAAGRGVDVHGLLWRSHWDRLAFSAEGEPRALFTAFADSAARPQRWHDSGRRGASPPGRLRPVKDGTLTSFTRAWATVLYHLVYDPDGRPIKKRIRRSF